MDRDDPRTLGRLRRTRLRLDRGLVNGTTGISELYYNLVDGIGSGFDNVALRS